MKKTIALFLLITCLFLIPTLMVGQVDELGGDLVIVVNTNDSGLKAYSGLNDHFVNQYPLDDAEVPSSTCGVISLVSNVAIVNEHNWSNYTDFKVRVSIVDQNTGLNLHMFTGQGPSPTYEPYLEYFTSIMSYCYTPVSCGHYTPSYFNINGITPGFGFYDSPTQTFLGCAAAAIWDVGSGTPNLIFNSPSTIPPIIPNVTSVTPLITTFHMTMKNYFYVLAPDVNPQLEFHIEVYGKTSSTSNYTYLSTQVHPNTVVVQNPITFSHGIDATLIGNPPNISTVLLPHCLIPLREAKQENLGLSVSLSPNPVQDRLNIAIEGDQSDQEYSLTVYDIQGNTVLKDKVQGGKGLLEKSLTVSELAQGCYFVKANNSDGMQIKKFVKI